MSESELRSGKGPQDDLICFVSACEQGHIDEFPFAQWIGCNCGSDAELYFKSGRSSASIQGTKIGCEKCGKSNSMAAAFQPRAIANKGIVCEGARPWLGEANGHGNCNHLLHTLIRGSSNIHFSAVESAIYVPKGTRDFDPKVQNLVDDPTKWVALTTCVVDGKINENSLKAIASLFRVNQTELEAAIFEKINEKRAPIKVTVLGKACAARSLRL